VDRPRILVIDELDRLATMPATQRELVRVLERRQARGNATLFAAREHPGRLAGLEEALRTRLLGGMVAQMKPPHPATVLARVKARLAKRGIRTETGVLARAVELGGGHPVAAETIVLEAAVAARSKGRPLVADQLVSPPRPEAADGPGSSRIDRLTARVSTYFAVSAADLRSPRKVRRALEPRRFLALLLRRAAGLRSAEIGCYLGGRSVSTVTALLRQGAALLERDPALREFFEQLHPSNDVDPSVRS
jgi:chromosomal replication initiator protein